MRHPRLFALALLILALLLYAGVYCLARPEPEPPPTFPGSATPSDTPEPPTMTASPTATVVPATVSLPGTGTAVTTLTPPGTVTAVPSATATPEPTETAKIAPTVEQLLIVKGITYWDTAKAKYGRFECWQLLKRENGWHERRLPIGEFMRLPGMCE